MENQEPISRHIEAGELQAVEDAWLEHLEQAEDELEFFAETARLLADHDELGQAEVLLELLVDHLGRDGDGYFELLRRIGELLFPEPTALHDEIIRWLRARYDTREVFEELCEKGGLHRAVEDIPKTWTKVDRLTDLLAYSEGTVVLMEGKGAGTIVEVNTSLESFRVELDRAGRVGVGFAAARKVLHPLPDTHILHRKLTRSDELAAMAKEHPDELVRITLSSYDEPLTAATIREALAGVVPEKGWTAFWARARKNPQLVALPGGRHRYRWADSADDALTHLREQFAGADTAGRLHLLRTHADRDDSLRRAMISELVDEATTLAAREPAVSFTIGLALERAGESTVDRPFDPVALIRAAPDPVRLAAELDDARSREELYRRLPETRDDWPQVFADAIAREGDARVLDHLADRLGRDHPEALEDALGILLNRPKGNPGGFTWLAERAANDESILQRSPLRLFRRIVAAFGDGDFSAYRRRLLTLIDSGSTLPRLLPFFDADRAARAETDLERASSLESYQREPLINAIHLRFPDLRSEEEMPLYALDDTIVAKREELRRLLEEEIPANRRAVTEARELGDLRENFEYKSARQRHEYLAAIASKLAKDLERVREIRFDTLELDAVRIGTTTVFADARGTTRSITILGPWESDPENGVLSNESELAQALLGLEPGDEAEIEGSRLAVTSIGPYR